MINVTNLTREQLEDRCFNPCESLTFKGSCGVYSYHGMSDDVGSDVESVGTPVRYDTLTISMSANLVRRVDGNRGVKVVQQISTNFSRSENLVAGRPTHLNAEPGSQSGINYALDNFGNEPDEGGGSTTTIDINYATDETQSSQRGSFFDFRAGFVSFPLGVEIAEGRIPVDIVVEDRMIQMSGAGTIDSNGREGISGSYNFEVVMRRTTPDRYQFWGIMPTGSDRTVNNNIWLNYSYHSPNFDENGEERRDENGHIIPLQNDPSAIRVSDVFSDSWTPILGEDTTFDGTQYYSEIQEYPANFRATKNTDGFITLEEPFAGLPDILSVRYQASNGFLSLTHGLNYERYYRPFSQNFGRASLRNREPLLFF